MNAPTKLFLAHTVSICCDAQMSVTGLADILVVKDNMHLCSFYGSSAGCAEFKQMELNVP